MNPCFLATFLLLALSQVATPKPVSTAHSGQVIDLDCIIQFNDPAADQMGFMQPDQFNTYCESNGVDIQNGDMFVGMHVKIKDIHQVPKIAKSPFVKALYPMKDVLIARPGPATHVSDKLQRLQLPVFVRRDNKKILALDLDETLIASSQGPCHKASCFYIQLDDRVIWVNRRPGVTEFLDLMAQHYTLVLYTRAHKSYADKVLEHLDPHGTLFSARLYRSASTKINDHLFTKDLLKVTPNLNRVLLVDNEPENFILNQNNGIHITTWTGTSYDSKFDTELTKLGNVLAYISSAEDMRLVLVDSYFRRIPFGQFVPSQRPSHSLSLSSLSLSSSPKGTSAQIATPDLNTPVTPVHNNKPTGTDQYTPSILVGPSRNTADNAPEIEQVVLSHIVSAKQ